MNKFFLKKKGNLSHAANLRDKSLTPLEQRQLSKYNIALTGQAGFTLVETMIVVALLSIIMAAIFTILGTGRNTWWANATNVEIRQDARIAKEWITKELQQGRRATISITGASSEVISFDVPLSVSDAGVVTWQNIQYAQGGTSNDQLIRTSGATTEVLANNISSISFTQNLSVPQNITVTIATTKTDKKGRLLNASLNFDINVRN